MKRGPTIEKREKQRVERYNRIEYLNYGGKTLPQQYIDNITNKIVDDNSTYEKLKTKNKEYTGIIKKRSIKYGDQDHARSEGFHDGPAYNDPKRGGFIHASYGQYIDEYNGYYSKKSANNIFINFGKYTNNNHYCTIVDNGKEVCMINNYAIYDKTGKKEKIINSLNEIKGMEKYYDLIDNFHNDIEEKYLANNQIKTTLKKYIYDIKPIVIETDDIESIVIEEYDDNLRFSDIVYIDENEPIVIEEDDDSISVGENDLSIDDEGFEDKNRRQLQSRSIQKKTIERLNTKIKLSTKIKQKDISEDDISEDEDSISVKNIDISFGDTLDQQRTNEPLLAHQNIKSIPKNNQGQQNNCIANRLATKKKRSIRYRLNCLGSKQKATTDKVNAYKQQNYLESNKGNNGQKPNIRILQRKNVTFEHTK